MPMILWTKAWRTLSWKLDCARDSHLVGSLRTDPCPAQRFGQQSMPCAQIPPQDINEDSEPDDPTNQVLLPE